MKSKKKNNQKTKIDPGESQQKKKIKFERTEISEHRSWTNLVVNLFHKKILSNEKGEARKLILRKTKTSTKTTKNISDIFPVKWMKSRRRKNG